MLLQVTYDISSPFVSTCEIVNIEYRESGANSDILTFWDSVFCLPEFRSIIIDFGPRLFWDSENAEVLVLSMKAGNDSDSILSEYNLLSLLQKVLLVLKLRYLNKLVYPITSLTKSYRRYRRPR
jgi:hypothetical protein